MSNDTPKVSSHSLLKTFRRCPKQSEYKYYRGLKRRAVSKPLKRGTWAHKLLEVHYSGGDWREMHLSLTDQFNELWDEEKEMYGDLPREMARMMRSYLWHYRMDHWRIHDVEFVLETTFPDGSIYRCKIDVLVEDQFGLWLVDHKTHAKLPDLTFRLLDAQSALYLWCALRNKIPVQGFIWNYVRTKPPTIPYITKFGNLSKRRIDTDYPTAFVALKKAGLLQENKQLLRLLQRQQFRPGEPQTSTFFRRDVLEKSVDMIKRVALENYHTAKRYHSYDFSRTDAVERVVSRSCTYDCSYTDICALELFGANPASIIKQRYEVVDNPMDYYDKEEADDAEFLN